MEELLVKKIRGGILGIKNGTKEPKEIAPFLNTLRPINPFLYEDLLRDYSSAVRGK